MLGQPKIDAIVARIEAGETVEDALLNESVVPANRAWFRANCREEIQFARQVNEYKSKDTAALDDRIVVLLERQTRLTNRLNVVSSTISKLQAERAAR